ncbi:unnamed protein product (macronuclear) [Paramecium tetraurelia]|uniref:Uncharacterized protein n=1 Tax=Paramecium tetraurelia TaxID=5888 RepID=A0CQV5_PARTE|nr:uncharacterized protein GSPATT00009520001 [Paramecium tetraurelia]CAK73172.1 unnamed protein product [Paramecium tetraurelia]|eukprot:XP_001440569.1 hypothetical protein (macronuclear) [Paramecium tetraurelia strain d4-2]
MQYRSKNEYQKLFDLKTIKYRMETLPSTSRKIQNHSLTNRSQQKEKTIASDVDANSKIDRQTYKHFLNFQNRRPTLNVQKNALFQSAIPKQSSNPLEPLHQQTYKQNQTQNKYQSQRDIILNTKFFVSPWHLHKKMKQEKNHQNQQNELLTDIPTKEKIIYLQSSQTDFLDLIQQNVCPNKNFGIKSKYQVISYAKQQNPQLISLKKDNENFDDDNSECNVVFFRSKKALQ